MHALTATLQGITSSYCFYFILGICLAYSLGQALVSQCFALMLMRAHSFYGDSLASAPSTMTISQAPCKIVSVSLPPPYPPGLSPFRTPCLVLYFMPSFFAAFRLPTGNWHLSFVRVVVDDVVLAATLQFDL